MTPATRSALLYQHRSTEIQREIRARISAMDSTDLPTWFTAHQPIPRTRLQRLWAWFMTVNEMPANLKESK